MIRLVLADGHAFSIIHCSKGQIETNEKFESLKDEFLFRKFLNDLTVVPGAKILVAISGGTAKGITQTGGEFNVQEFK